MLAALYRSPGPADVVRIEEVEAPRPGPGEVRVRLRVAGINPTDGKMRVNGKPDGFQVPGQDGAGDVVEVGEGVDPARVGERVWVWFASARGRRWGSCAQETVVPARQAVPLPDGVSYDLGACLGIPAMTAWYCLYADGPMDGRTVLVAGWRRRGRQRGHRAGPARRCAGDHDLEPGEGDLGGGRGRRRRAGPARRGPRRAGARGGAGRRAPIVEVALGANLALDLAVLAPHGAVSTYADDPLQRRPGARPHGRQHDAAVRAHLRGGRRRARRGRAGGVGGGGGRGHPVLPVTRRPLAELGAVQDEVLAGADGKVLLEMPS